MYKIGILGSENSHAPGFLDIINRPGPDGAYRYPDCRVVAVGGHYPEESRKLQDTYALDFVADSPAEMLGRVDAVMVTARDGAFHRELVEPFLAAGIPAFIDKPFTVSEEDTLALVQVIQQKQVPVCGGSSLKYAYDVALLRNAVCGDPEAVHGGSVTAPLDMDNPYSGFFFYSSHLAEISMAVFGYDPRTVTAQVTDKGDVTALVDYGRYVVANHFMNGCYHYHGSVMRKDRIYAREIDMAFVARQECDDFVSMLRTGRMTHSLRELIAPVFYLNAVERAFRTGETAAIEIPEV